VPPPEESSAADRLRATIDGGRPHASKKAKIDDGLRRNDDFLTIEISDEEEDEGEEEDDESDGESDYDSGDLDEDEEGEGEDEPGPVAVAPPSGDEEGSDSSDFEPEGLLGSKG
jgi:hypothetical protein